MNIIKKLALATLVFIASSSVFAGAQDDVAQLQKKLGRS